MCHGKTKKSVLVMDILRKKAENCLLSGVDITGPKLEEEVFLASEEQYRTIILQTAMDGFWLVNLQGFLLEVNATYCQMSGYGRQELLGKKISDFEVVESAEDTAVHIKKIIEKGEDRFETRHRRKDGSI
jgi:PAS domain S-box-containing protein